MRSPISLLGLLAAISVGVTAACSPASPSGHRLQVVTTVSPITSMVANVAGPDADVAGVVPEGSNSHTFEPPPSVARRLSRADVIFVNGLKLEDPVAELARSTKKSPTRVVALGERTVEPSGYLYDFSFPRAGGKPNPHLWTSPVRARRYVKVITDELIKADASHAAGYRQRGRAYEARIDELDRQLRIALATVDPDHRRLLTYHDAYAYFASDYGWQVIGAIQPSDFNDPTAREVGRLIDQIKAENVPAIFGSEVFPSPVLAQIGRETGVRYVDELRDDDLPGRPGEPKHSYVALMKLDFTTIVTALGGDASALARLDVTDVSPDQARYPQ